MSSVYLRDSDTIYLLGNYESTITGSKLHSVKQVLSVLFFNLRVVKLNLRESATLAVQEAIIFWEKSRIPTRDVKHCISKLEALYDEWRQIQKHAGRTTSSHMEKESAFQSKLDDLFDIAHADAMERINLEEDKQFLINQRLKGRPGYICGIDYKGHSRELITEERKERVLMRKDRSNRELQQLRK